MALSTNRPAPDQGRRPQDAPSLTGAKKLNEGPHSLEALQAPLLEVRSES